MHGVPVVSRKFDYAMSHALSCTGWTVLRKLKGRGHKWDIMNTGLNSRSLAIDRVLELVNQERFNPVQDHLNNIDDDVNLNKEGWDN